MISRLSQHFLPEQFDANGMPFVGFEVFADRVERLRYIGAFMIVVVFAGLKRTLCQGDAADVIFRVVDPEHGAFRFPEKNVEFDDDIFQRQCLLHDRGMVICGDLDSGESILAELPLAGGHAPGSFRLFQIGVVDHFPRSGHEKGSQAGRCNPARFPFSK